MSAPAGVARPRVTAVVLNWNNYDDSRRCLDALLSSGYANLRIIVVDNASTDGSHDRLLASYPQLEHRRNDKNLGFSRGCNAGIREALKEDACAFVLLVNNDCQVAHGSIESAVAAAESDGGIGVVTAKILDEKGRIWHAGGTISLMRGQSRTRGFREMDIGQFQEACDTEWASGALMLITRAVLERVGLLPEQYFFGVEEWDFSLSVRNAGYRIRYVPAFWGIHPGGGSHDNHDPKFAYNYYRNKLIFQEKHLGPALFRLWLLAFRVYLRVKMRRHIKYLASITYADPSMSPVEDVVFAAQCALEDHGSGPLDEHTMLHFERTMAQRRASKYPRAA
jgi:hypothetical protein